MATLDPEALYQQLGRLIETMPNLKIEGTYSAEILQWLGRAFALVSETGEVADIVDMRSTCDRLTATTGNAVVRGAYADRMAAILYRALGIVETRAPVSAQGAFIPAGSPFDALAAVGKVLQSAAQDVLIVDPYMDEKALADFAPSAAENVSIRLLADNAFYKPSLPPAVRGWVQQFATRPLQARLTPARTLHDRLIIVDNSTVYTLTQSLNAFAARSPASIVRVDHETGALKIAAYQAMWNAATVIN